MRVDAERGEDAVVALGDRERRRARTTRCRADRDDPRRRPPRGRARRARPRRSAHASRCACVSITPRRPAASMRGNSGARRLDPLGGDGASRGESVPARDRRRLAERLEDARRASPAGTARARRRPRAGRRRGCRAPRRARAARASSLASCHGARSSTYWLRRRTSVPDRSSAPVMSKRSSGSTSVARSASTRPTGESPSARGSRRAVAVARDHRRRPREEVAEVVAELALVALVDAVDRRVAVLAERRRRAHAEAHRVGAVDVDQVERVDRRCRATSRSCGRRSSR